MSAVGGATDGPTPAEIRERAVLVTAVTLFPERLTIDELLLAIAEDPADSAERDGIRNAVRDLRGAGLVRYENEAQLVEPTHAAFTAFGLLNS